MTERLFLAIPITNALRERLRELQEISLETLGQHGIRNVRPENLNNSHITVRFLGDVEQSAMKKLIGEIEQLTLRQTAFEFSIEKIGVFDSPQKARVLWAAINNLVSFCRVRDEIDALLEPHGFERESKSFTPHLTLTRFREPQDIRECFEELQQLTDVCSIERYPVTEVALYSSKLSPHGATHTKRASVNLEPLVI